jgi:hypothetical protein
MTEEKKALPRTAIFDRIPHGSKLMAEMMPEGAKALLLAFGRCDLKGVLPESVGFLKDNGLIERATSLNGTAAWIVTPEGKRVRKALEKTR